MATWLRQSTSVDVPIGPFLDETDGKTAETALTITQPDIRLKKNSAAWAQKNAAQTLSHEEAGWYEVTLDATDTNTLGILVVAIHESGALPVWREFMVVTANVWDSYMSSDLLDVSLVQVAGSTTNVAALATNVDAIITDTADMQPKLGTPAGGSISADILVIDNLVDDLESRVGTPSNFGSGATVAANLVDIEAQTDDIGAAGAGLTAIPTVAAVTTVTNLTNAPTNGDLTATMKASVNAEVLDVLNVDTFAEPGQGNPPATATLVQKISYLYKAWRNRSTVTASEYALYADNGTTKDQEAAVSDDGTTFERAEIVTGA